MLGRVLSTISALEMKGHNANRSLKHTASCVKGVSMKCYDMQNYIRRARCEALEEQAHRDVASDHMYNRIDRYLLIVAENVQPE